VEITAIFIIPNIMPHELLFVSVIITSDFNLYHTIMDECNGNLFCSVEVVIEFVGV